MINVTMACKARSTGKESPLKKGLIRVNVFSFPIFYTVPKRTDWLMSYQKKRNLFKLKSEENSVHKQNNRPEIFDQRAISLAKPIKKGS